MFKITIIEDDISIALDFEIVLHELGIKDINKFSSIEDALVSIQKIAPDLILLDIKLKGVDGLEIFKKINLSSTPVIVITGYQNQSMLDILTKNKVQSLMIKPVNHLALKYEIIKILEGKKAAEESSFTYLDFKSKLQKLAFSEILYLETEGNYTTIHTSDKKHIIKKSLAKVSMLLPLDTFQRIFRSIIVNLNHVESINYASNIVILGNGVKLALGAKYKSEIKTLMIKKYKVVK